MVFGILQVIGILLSVLYGTSIIGNMLNKYAVPGTKVLLFSVGIVLIFIRYIQF